MAGNDNHTYGFSKDDADALIGMISMGETETPGRRFGGGSGLVIMTPDSGIPARVGTLVGRGDCTIYRIDDSHNLESTGAIVNVVNIAADAVAGGVYAQAKRAAGRWVIDFEECDSGY